MKKSVKSSFTLLSVVALSSSLLLPNTASAANAQSDYTHYVTDSVKIPLRTQPGYKYKIKRLLASGTPVTIVEVNDDGWTKLIYKHNGDDIEGWMPSSVLLNQPIARVRLEDQIKKTSRVEKTLNQVRQEKDTLNARFNDASTELKNVKEQNFKLEKQLKEIQSISGKSIQLHEENIKLNQSIAKLQSDNAIMKEQLSQAEDVVKRQWFLTGGGVLLLGLLIGRFFRVPNRRGRWDTL